MIYYFAYILLGSPIEIQNIFQVRPGQKWQAGYTVNSSIKCSNLQSVTGAHIFHIFFINVDGGLFNLRDT